MSPHHNSSFLYPWASPQSAKCINTSQLSQKCECKPRILIVDDSEFNLIPLRLLIREFILDENLIEKVIPNYIKPSSSVKKNQKQSSNSFSLNIEELKEEPQPDEDLGSNFS